jgi:N-carbamoyl-L-amino-acid hydrolase
VLLVERLARETGRGMVGTVGFIEARPNMINIVPGEVGPPRGLPRDRPGGDRRDARLASSAARRRSPAAGLAIEWTSLMRDLPLTVPPEMVALAEASARAVDIPHRRLTSGASHDANHMAALCPIGLVFIPCRDGRSHCPEEWADVEHPGDGRPGAARASPASGPRPRLNQATLTFSRRAP